MRLLMIVVASMLALGACGASNEVVKPPPTEPVEPADPLASFNGERQDADKAIELAEMPIGINGVGIIFELMKVEEQEWKEPGKPTTKETKAVLSVKKGAETKTVTIDEGAKKTRFGCVIHVIRAQVDYIEKRQDYLPRATLKIACGG